MEMTIMATEHRLFPLEVTMDVVADGSCVSSTCPFLIST